MTKWNAGWRTVYSVALYVGIYLLLKYAYEQAGSITNFAEDSRPIWRACFACCAAVILGGGLVMVMFDVTGKED